MAESPSAVCYSRMGASTQKFGGLCQWLTITFNIVSGNFDRHGGAMFTTPAFDLVKITDNSDRPNTYGSKKSRVRGLPYNNNEFPVSVLAEEILTPGDDQVRALIALAGNPIISAPNGRRLAEAFTQLEFMVSADIYLNETSKFADIILPAASGLQISQYDVAFHINAVRNTAKYSAALYEPKKNQKADWEIVTLLNTAINQMPDDGITPEMILDRALRSGPYAGQGMCLEMLKQHPHGVDLGPLESNLIDRLQTPDRKIHLAPQIYLDDLARLEQTFLGSKSAAHKFPLSLVSRRVPRSHNSWTHNSHRLAKGKQQCTMLVNPDDAEALQLFSGQMALVKSEVGELTVEVAVSDEMMAGVVSIPHGWGHNMEGTQMGTARIQPGVNVNDLTDDDVVDELTGNACFSGIPVSLTPIMAESHY